MLDIMHAFAHLFRRQRNFLSYCHTQTHRVAAPADLLTQHETTRGKGQGWSDTSQSPPQERWAMLIRVDKWLPKTNFIAPRSRRGGIAIAAGRRCGYGAKATRLRREGKPEILARWFSPTRIGIGQKKSRRFFRRDNIKADYLMISFVSVVNSLELVLSSVYCCSK